MMNFQVNFLFLVNILRMLYTKVGEPALVSFLPLLQRLAANREARRGQILSKTSNFLPRPSSSQKKSADGCENLLDSKKLNTVNTKKL